MTSRYRAFLIGNSTYPEDAHNLQTLEGPVNDVTLLRAALEDAHVGMFARGDVTVRPERTSYELLHALDEFFSAATRDEVLLLYYSGHGRLDETNTLYLCCRDTRTDRLRSTAISSRRLGELIDGSAATRTVIMLDCCHSGAFKGADLTGPLAGTGRYVLTSCRTKELANDASMANHASLFTEHVVTGLLGAAASQPANSHMTLEELYTYVRDRLAAQGRQRPQFASQGEGGLRIARRADALIPASPPRPASSHTPAPVRRVDMPTDEEMAGQRRQVPGRGGSRGGGRARLLLPMGIVLSLGMATIAVMTSWYTSREPRAVPPHSPSISSGASPTTSAPTEPPTAALRQIRPTDGTVVQLLLFVRRNPTTLTWAAVSGAVEYRVEVECLGCIVTGAWSPATGTPATTRATTYSFLGPDRTADFRWRVTAMSVSGSPVGTSAWWRFSYRIRTFSPPPLPSSG